MPGTVFVPGAAGTTGSTLVRFLGARGVPVRAGVHTPESAPDWGDDVEVVGIDLSDADSLSAAFDGVSHLYLVTPFVADPERLVEPAVEATVDAFRSA